MLHSANVHVLNSIQLTVYFLCVCVCVFSPLLTWRDVQHIIVQTSKAHHLIAPDWRVNGAGYKGALLDVRLQTVNSNVCQ